MGQSHAMRIIGVKETKEVDLPSTLLTFFCSSPVPLRHEGADRSTVIKATSASMQATQGTFYKYADADAVEVLNHNEFEDEAVPLKDEHSERILKILFYIFQENKLIVFDSSRGYRQIEQHINGSLPKYFSSYPEAKSLIDKVVFEEISSYREPNVWIGKRKETLKSVTIRVPSTNLKKKGGENAFDLLTPESDLYVDIKVYAKKRGGKILESTSTEIMNLINEIGEKNIDRVSAREFGSYEQILKSNSPKFEIEGSSDLEVFRELEEIGEQLISDYGDILLKGHND